jgi:hypothetical protein
VRNVPTNAANRHDAFMKDQRARDEQTVTIATALIAFLGTLGVGIVLLLIIGWATDVGQAFETGFSWAIAAAGLAVAAYCVRHRR